MNLFLKNFWNNSIRDARSSDKLFLSKFEFNVTKICLSKKRIVFAWKYCFKNFKYLASLS